MPVGIFVLFESHDFTDENEMTKEIFEVHNDILKECDINYWCGQGTAPGTFAYRIEQLRLVEGPERPPNNQNTTSKNEDSSVITESKPRVNANWHDYYKYIFAEEEPLFLGTEGKFFDMTLQVIDLMLGNDYPLKEFIELTNMNNCLLLPYMIDDKWYKRDFKIRVMHCLYPQEELPRWFPYKSFLNGLNGFEFDTEWKRFDPWLAFAPLRSKHHPIPISDGKTIPHFKDFLAVESKEDFSKLWGKDSDCKPCSSHLKNMANGFLLIPSLLDYFGIHECMPCAELGFKISLHMKMLLQERKNTKNNVPVPKSAFKYIYRLLCWIWAVEKGCGFPVNITPIMPLNDDNEIKTTNHLIRAIREAKTVFSKDV